MYQWAMIDRIGVDQGDDGMDNSSEIRSRRRQERIEAEVESEVFSLFSNSLPLQPLSPIMIDLNNISWSPSPYSSTEIHLQKRLSLPGPITLHLFSLLLISSIDLQLSWLLII